jgi:hypothetical protein
MIQDSILVCSPNPRILHTANGVRVHFPNSKKWWAVAGSEHPQVLLLMVGPHELGGLCDQMGHDNALKI